MWCDKVLAFFGADKVKRGAVTGKTHYPPTAPKQLHGDVLKNKYVAVTIPGSTEGWSITVDGYGRFGGLVKEEIYVSEMQYNNTEIGDDYNS